MSQISDLAKTLHDHYSIANLETVFTRKTLPGLVEIDFPIDLSALRSFYMSAKSDNSGTSAYEYQSIEGLDLLDNVSNYTTYWPLVLSDIPEQVVSAQATIDSIRGITWQDHQLQIGARRRIKSMAELNDDYDPIIDERLCLEYSSEIIDNTYMADILHRTYSRYSRVRFACLKAGEVVHTHIDNDPSMIIRMHIPLWTNEHCYNGFIKQNAKTEQHMQCGKVYLVNNGIPHYAYNSGDTDRIHLVISLLDHSIFAKYNIISNGDV